MNSYEVMHGIAGRILIKHKKDWVIRAQENHTYYHIWPVDTSEEPLWDPPYITLRVDASSKISVKYSFGMTQYFEPERAWDGVYEMLEAKWTGIDFRRNARVEAMIF